MAIRRYMLIVALVGSIGTMLGATAATGVFTVAAGKTVQFASGTETDLYKWADAVALAEAAGSGWTMLTGAEWSYLLASGRPDAENKNALGTVNGKKGLIILPDEWTQPAGAPVFKTVTETGISYEFNPYTTAEWALMATAGAVFLPCGGYGYDDGQGGVTIENEDDHGAYWASDEYADNKDHANCMRFNTDGSGGIHDFNHQLKTTYYSVILVRETPAPVEEIILDEMDEIGDYTTKWTAAKAKSFAYVRRTLRKDGTFYTLCLPFDVPNIEASPLAGAEVFAFAGGSVSGAAGSEVLHLTLTPLAGTRLSAGVPYILRWANTGETLATPLYFASVENWDNNTTAETEPGNETIKLRGVYPKAHIPGYETGEEPHYNFFMGANNTLYWPDDTLYPEAQGYDMKGFRAYFYIVHEDPDPSPAPYRTMPAVWDIKSGVNSTTGTQNTEYRVQTGKQLRNGQVVLVIDGKMYDLKGLKIED